MRSVIGCVVGISVSLAVLRAVVAAELTSQDMEQLRSRARAEKWTFTVGETPATRRPREQLCGLRVPPNWKQKGGVRSPLLKSAKAGSLPSAFDWRAQNGCTPIRDQGYCGSCWAFGTVGALECAIKIRDGVDVDLSEQWLVSCNRESYGCDGGYYVHEYHQNTPGKCGGFGAVLESAFPYQALDTACGGPYAHHYVIDSWGYVGANAETPTVQEIKQAIYTYGPVAVCVTAGSYAFGAYTGGVFNFHDTDPTDHIVCLVGWDDSQGSAGVWILRNSWDTTWGEGGYMRIEYGRCTVGEYATYVVYSGSSNLTVSPTTDLTTMGPDGGPFEPNSKTYTLTNGGSSSLSWTASHTQSWCSITPASGTLAAGQSVGLVVSINSSADVLSPGDYQDNITVTDTTSGKTTALRAVLTIGSQEGFETGDFSSLPWVNRGLSLWEVSSDDKHSGTYAARTNIQGSGRRAILEVTLNCVAGTASFWHKIIPGADNTTFVFCIDGEPQLAVDSPNSTWMSCSCSISPGCHTFSWAFDSTPTNGTGLGVAWLDDIQIPVGSASPPHAINRSVSVPMGTAWRIGLPAIDDVRSSSGSPMDYVITALPTHGRLSDPNGGTIKTVPYTLLYSGRVVAYTPTAAYFGSDSFRFKANDGASLPLGGYSNEATVAVTVLDGRPPVPTGPSPSSGSTGRPLTVGLSWSDTSGSGRPTSLAIGVLDGIPSVVDFSMSHPNDLRSVVSCSRVEYGAVEFAAGGDRTGVVALGRYVPVLDWIDVATGDTTTIGSPTPASGERWCGMATDPTTGTTYAIGTNVSTGVSSLYTIDLNGGTATRVAGVLGAGNVHDIAIDAKGQIFAVAGSGSVLVRIHRTGGVATVVGSLEYTLLNGEGELDFDEDTGVLYLAGESIYPDGTYLCTVNSVTGAASWYGEMGTLSPGRAVHGKGLVIASTSGQTVYDVYLGSTNPPATLVGQGLSEPNFAPSGLGANKTYYWRVVARNDVGQAIGPVWSFKTVTSPPSAVITPSPAAVLAGTTATLTVGVTGGMPPYSYAWSSGQMGSSLSTVLYQSTWFRVVVTDAVGQTTTADITVPAVGRLSVLASAQPATVVGGGSTTLAAAPSGGAGPYSYSWNTGQTTQSFGIHPSQTATYSVTVADASNQRASAEVTVTVVGTPSLTVSAEPNAIPAGQTAILTAVPSGGISPYLISWSSGQAGASISVQPAITTTYQATLVDALSQRTTAEVTVEVAAELLATAQANPPSIPLGNSTQLSAVVSGGRPPYVYSWSTGSNEATTTVQPTEKKTYSVMVRDSVNQMAYAEVTVDVTVTAGAFVPGTFSPLCLTSAMVPWMLLGVLGAILMRPYRGRP